MNIAVLAGGRSAEHEISQLSGYQVLQNLCGREWRVWPVFIDRDGQWSVPDRPFSIGEDNPFDGSGACPLRPGAALVQLLDRCSVSLVFPVLHGRHGEDGTVQGMLELHDVAFVGSDTAASAVAMDKLRTRECLRSHGLPMPKAYLPDTCLAAADAATEAQKIEAEIGFPCIAKVDHSGSTIGVEEIAGYADLDAFLQKHRHAGRRFMAEAVVHGEEITVPVLGNTGSTLQALPPIGIYPRHGEFFTYEAKYHTGMCEEIVPPRGLDHQQIREVMDLGRRCHAALQCDGLSRTDMIITQQGPTILEVNTLPGMTKMSLLPKSAAVHGLQFPALLDHLLDLAMQRWGVRSIVS